MPQYTVTVKQGKNTATANVTCLTAGQAHKLVVPFLCIGLDIASMTDNDVEITIDKVAAKAMRKKQPYSHKSVLARVSKVLGVVK